jgi:hypothetical protein
MTRSMSVEDGQRFVPQPLGGNPTRVAELSLRAGRNDHLPQRRPPTLVTQDWSYGRSAPADHGWARLIMMDIRTGRKLHPVGGGALVRNDSATVSGGYETTD